ncbi:hypothetical protein [Actinobacillus capsulatus]|uniref:hypothetical protein n=1 Tax=Actinobacillus capsulatus TaxID=717 RepID=UPI0003A00002|nr:hypothetical protein [Actinobacillus capsulatus]
MAAILNELLPCVQAQQIKRDGKVYPAPIDAWIYAINSMLANRHHLKLPMKNHGYLFEVISCWQGQAAGQIMAKTPTHSKTLSTIKGIQAWANNG